MRQQLFGIAIFVAGMLVGQQIVPNASESNPFDNVAEYAQASRIASADQIERYRAIGAVCPSQLADCPTDFLRCDDSTCPHCAGIDFPTF